MKCSTLLTLCSLFHCEGGWSVTYFPSCRDDTLDHTMYMYTHLLQGYTVLQHKGTTKVTFKALRRLDSHTCTWTSTCTCIQMVSCFLFVSKHEYMYMWIYKWGTFTDLSSLHGWSSEDKNTNTCTCTCIRCYMYMYVPCTAKTFWNRLPWVIYVSLPFGFYEPTTVRYPYTMYMYLYCMCHSPQVAWWNKIYPLLHLQPPSVLGEHCTRKDIHVHVVTLELLSLSCFVCMWHNLASCLYRSGGSCTM